MRVLHCIATLRTGGAENLLVDLLPALRDRGNDVELLVIDGTKTPFYEQLEQNGIPIHPVTTGGSIYNPQNILKISKLIDGYDITHTHTYPCQLFIPLAKLLSRSKCHLVTTEHSTNNHRRGKWWFRLLDNWMYHKYDRIIAITELVKDNLEQHLGGGATKSIVINNGINYNKFYNPIKESLPRIKVITMVASMRDAKDQDTLIRALAHLPKEFKLNLVGDGPRRSKLEQLANELDVDSRVMFLGNRNNVPEILKESDVIVLSSHWEGLSLACLEGMACGRPFIASEVEGLKDIVSGYGILFSHGNHVELAQIISQLSEDASFYHNVAEQCQQRAKQFDISETAKKYNELYISL